MKLTTFHELFVHKLQDLYSAEQQIVDALPKMIEAASSQELAEGFTKHLKQTRQQVVRLEEIGELLGENMEGVRCAGMEGVLTEGKEIMQSGLEGSVLDAALIGAAQVVEHYEISNYGTLCEMADIMEHKEVKELLKETLDEEEETDKILSHLAKDINKKANLA
jgi:ferritin-like metal-binding protein YciE